ncbi:UNVERIFIED_CONTAM: hypothetical protein K2H54_057969 [Gekko kuhli]
MLEQSVGEWLESIGLQQYESKLLLNGFDDVRFLTCKIYGTPSMLLRIHLQTIWFSVQAACAVPSNPTKKVKGKAEFF